MATAVVEAGRFSAVTLRRLESLSSLALDLDGLGLRVAAIDIPIGLPAGTRLCDRRARQLLGARRSSVFSAPPRAVLDADDYAEARRRAIEATGRSLSVQAFNLVPKIREVDALLDVASRRDRLVEAHPELAFLRLHGGPLPDPKRSAGGRAGRRRLVERLLGTGTVGGVLATRTVPLEDALDALVLLSTARHLLDGSATLLGSGHDEAGRPTRIAY